ncbi:MAG TPA: rhodanese-like domain-containing protein [Terriglobales bacterium]|nr:rhodanese-like domain-containing protein [Terriglobales bacterium]
MAKPQAQSSEIATIARQELASRLQERALVILNVTPKESYADGHIPGSISLPVVDIESKARLLISNLDQEIAVYCAGPT